jgi:hypothetical protein
LARRCCPRLRAPRSITVSDDRVTFASGASFAKDTLLRTNVEQLYRLDVLCFLAKFRARNAGAANINPAAYLKARAPRSAPLPCLRTGR